MALTWHEETQRLIGKRVTVLYDSDPPGGKALEATGVLQAVDDDGSVQVEDDKGWVHFIWPALVVVEA